MACHKILDQNYIGSISGFFCVIRGIGVHGTVIDTRAQFILNYIQVVFHLVQNNYLHLFFISTQSYNSQSQFETFC